DHLYWLLTELARGPQHDQQICGLSSLSQEIENLISKDARQKARLTWSLTRVISDIAVVAEIQRQLGLSTCNEFILSLRLTEENKSWYEEWAEPSFKINGVFRDYIGHAHQSGLPPLVTDLRCFDYPSHRPRNAANTIKMRSAEEALDHLWDAIDQRFTTATGKTLSQLVEGKDQHRERYRTPASDPQDSVEDIDAALALAILEERTESTIKASRTAPARQKVKTRSSPLSESSITPEEKHTASANHTAPSNIPHIKVKKKAFNTFTALFGRPVADRLPGELPWNDFKKAMVNVGFSAEKLQGSAWLFAPVGTAAATLKYSIIFHEPHPDSKIPMQWARRMARRLNRNFGWTAESFVIDRGMEDGGGGVRES
ncbi:MAG: hypothetical protein Q9219_005853, partial [cf. Caloplaca sp. 3 TL-2023]